MELADINSLGLLDNNILPVQVGFTLNIYCVACKYNLCATKPTSTILYGSININNNLIILYSEDIINFNERKICCWLIGKS